MRLLQLCLQGAGAGAGAAVAVAVARGFERNFLVRNPAAGGEKVVHLGGGDWGYKQMTTTTKKNTHRNGSINQRRQNMHSAKRITTQVCMY